MTIPAHLTKYDWYALHLAWMKTQGYTTRHNPGDVTAKRADLRGADLRDAYLSGAYLSGADLSGADLRDADLRDAYLSGAYLSGADLSGADLSGADLSGADLRDAYLSGAYLSGADLSGADLSGADLRDAYLSGADLSDAKNVPDMTNLPPPDYAAMAKRYRKRNPDVPVIADLDAKILEAITHGKGKLDMGQWHTCKTTHCRAGWAITLAGKDGKRLEDKYGPYRAGAMLYRASTGRMPDFFATTDAALDDIMSCAGVK